MATPPPQSDGARFPRYIAIDGPIGVGKTTLAGRLAESLGYPLLLEPADDNPFLDRFYREGRRHALPTQLYFLLNRARQMQELARGDLFGSLLVADFVMEKDRLFARVTLDANEYSLYQQIHENLAIDSPPPDLVIYLQAPARVLLERVRRRGIPAEQYIDADYLNTLIDAYTDFFHYYDAAPLLIVNAAEIDIANNDGHYHSLLEQIRDMDGARQYFNPHPTLI